ncbi:MAG: carbon-nitrogen family hydrolase [bacterium]|nr:carbon-nitrogen family hydrolase [bacterium]
MDSTFTIHLLQWRVVPGDIEENLKKAEGLLAKAGPGNGDVVLLPEMFPSGFYYKDLDQMASGSGRVLEWMARTAASSGVHLAGSLPVHRESGIANSLILVGPGGQTVATYDKIHLFPMTGEHLHFLAGGKTVIADLGGFPAGMAICFDLRYPELTRRLCRDGARLTIVSAQWPEARIDHFRDLVRVRALENQMFVAACNSFGDNGKGLVMGGNSMVVNPWGEVLGSLGDGEGVLSVPVDMDQVRKLREKFPVLESARTDLFK